MNNFYLENKELWDIDNSYDGYEWIEYSQDDLNVISYKRKAIDLSELLIVINFSPVMRENYKVNVAEAGNYQEILSTDEIQFGGNGSLNSGVIKSNKEINSQGEIQNFVNINLPPLSGIILRKVKGRVRRV